MTSLKLDGSILWTGEAGNARKIGARQVRISGWPYSKTPRLHLDFVKNSDPHDVSSLIYTPIPDSLEEAIERVPQMINQMVKLQTDDMYRADRAR